MAGTILLSLPPSWADGKELHVIDACFLATSAVCVTGLTTVDVGSTLSPFGLGVLLLLIQLGGLGVMTYTSLIFLLWRRHVPFHSREAVSHAILGGGFDLKAFLRQISALTFCIESVAALSLYLHDPIFFHPFSAMFHAISAFCNAGFSLAPDNLMGFRNDPIVNLIITFSIICGGIGFGVLREILGVCSKGRLGAPTQSFGRLSRIMIKTSLFLIVGGTTLIFCIEFFRAGNEQSIGDGLPLLMTSYFHSVSARTAGFNTVNLASLSEAGLLVLMALMFIGGGPGSCAGGIKVSTFRVLAGFVAAQFRGDKQIVLQGRGVPNDNVSRALTLFFLYSMCIALSSFLLSITENGILHRTGREEISLIRILFEVVSALGTVGLSINLTPLLSFEGKIIIIINMFAGRVGLLSLLMAVQSLRARKSYALAESQLPIG